MRKNVTRRVRRKQKGGSKRRDIFVITLDTESARYKTVSDSLKGAGVAFHPYPAVNGSKLNRDTLPTLGIGRALFQSRKEGSKPHNLGAIGCFLSHRNLYKDILDKPKGPDTEYIVFEDDVIIPKDFNTILEERLKHVPHDWDVVYMSKGYPEGKNIGHGVIRLSVEPTATKSFGTWAYIIKERYVKYLHGFLEHMTDQIDAQINRTFGTHKAYCFDGGVITTQHVNSTIADMENHIL